ncbi:LysR family transcriptional regulator (plasmid) [Phyllobacterium sp. 628]|uniref:LysR family transcriptional regulator n=1 Tax=Phyllobacterium sp. 628 TaxID=2718938 RepID=UPI0016622AF6|nr:LysR family transcriptional regulator [Phyllobacterium sp. 628]QND54361.1 LysR family transcriptional regulator [Phyllobacterium sp. 628]
MLHARLLKYLDAVAHYGSIRKAGEQLSISSSAINRQILALEQALDTPLFQRLPHGMVLTHAGDVLLEHVRETLRAMDRTRITIEEIKGIKHGTVSLAVVSGLAGTIVPSAISKFRKTHPSMKFNVNVRSRAEILAMVCDGTADLGLGFNLEESDDISILTSVSSRLGAVTNPAHPLSANKTRRFSDCLKYPLCIAEAAIAIRKHIDNAAAEAGFTIETLVETNTVEVMRRMVMLDDCVTFLSPFDIYPEKASGQLVYLPLDSSPFPLELVSLIGRRGVTNFLVAGLADTISALLRECVSP